MNTLKEILKGVDAALGERIEMALGLIDRQSVGAERYRSEKIRSILKDDRSPVTVADLLHQAQLQQRLARQFPDDALICEEPRSLVAEVIEEAAEVSRRLYGMELDPKLVDLPESGRVTWLLDPIDGTKGYLADRHYAIAVGFFVEGQPFFGAMAVPADPKSLDFGINASVAFAVRGGGSWIRKIGAGGAEGYERLSAEALEDRRPFRFAVSLEHAGGIAHRLEQSGDVELIKMDSQAKYLAVAAGDLDAYLRLQRNDGQPDLSWDHMPGALIASEAGCTVMQFDGQDIRFLPQVAVEIELGMACFRGGRQSELAAMVRRLTSAQD